jgi:hypothetical protein
VKAASTCDGVEVQAALTRQVQLVMLSRARQWPPVGCGDSPNGICDVLQHFLPFDSWQQTACLQKQLLPPVQQQDAIVLAVVLHPEDRAQHERCMPCSSITCHAVVAAGFAR